MPLPRVVEHPLLDPILPLRKNRIVKNTLLNLMVRHKDILLFFGSVPLRIAKTDHYFAQSLPLVGVYEFLVWGFLV